MVNTQRPDDFLENPDDVEGHALPAEGEEDEDTESPLRAAPVDDDEDTEAHGRSYM